MAEQPHDHATPADLLEIHEILEWQAAVADAAFDQEGDA